jgi:hypothetical protein
VRAIAVAFRDAGNCGYVVTTSATSSSHLTPTAHLGIYFIHDLSDTLDTFGGLSTQQNTETIWRVLELFLRLRLHLTMDFSFESHRAAFAIISPSSIHAAIIACTISQS